MRIRSTLVVTVDASKEDYMEDGIELTLDMVGKQLVKGALPDVKVAYQLSSARIEETDEKAEGRADSGAAPGESQGDSKSGS